VSYTMSSDIVIVAIGGLCVTNHKSARSAHPAILNNLVAEERTAANVAVAKHLQSLGYHLSLSWASANGRLVRFVARDSAGACLRARSVTLVRLAGRPLVDESESLSSALSAVRDGVAEALGIDDAELMPAWGPNGESVRREGAPRWHYEQRKGDGVIVRIEI
jgi:hypothetical protein